MKIATMFNYVITPLIISNSNIERGSDFKWNYFQEDLKREKFIYAFNQAEENWNKVLKWYETKDIMNLDTTSLSKFSEWFGLLIKKIDVILNLYNKEILHWLPESVNDFNFIKDIHVKHPVRFTDFNTIPELGGKFRSVFVNLENIWDKFQTLYKDLKNIPYFN